MQKISMDSGEIVLVNKSEVSCDGGAGPLGHPKVYLNISKTGQIDCPYCGKRFILEGKVAI